MSISSSAIQSVRIGALQHRCIGDVELEPLRRHEAAGFARFRAPFSVRSTSVQPVNRFSWFQCFAVPQNRDAAKQREITNLLRLGTCDASWRIALRPA